MMQKLYYCVITVSRWINFDKFENTWTKYKDLIDTKHLAKHL